MSSNEQNTGTSSNKKLFSILCYIGILWLIGLLSEGTKNDPDVRFHINQGIVLSIFGLAVGVLGGAIPFLGWFIIAPIGSIMVLIFAIMGIINANKNVQKDLPLIGKIRILK